MASLVVTVALGGAASALAASPATAPTAFGLSPDGAAGTATMSWAPPADTGGAPVTGYRVARTGIDANGTGPWSTILPASARIFTFTLLKERTAYQFSVRAITAAGWGAPATASITPDVTSSPGPPVTGQVSYILDSTNAATVTWQPPTVQGGSPVIGYRLARDGYDRNGTGPWSTTLPASARSFTFTLLGPVTYRVTVQAVTRYAVGEPASILLIHDGPPRVMQPVDGPTVVTSDAAGGSVTIGWGLAYAGSHSYPPSRFVVGRDGRDTSGAGPWSTVLAADAQSFTFTKLKRGVPYSFTVSGDVPWGVQSSNSVTVTL